MRHLYILAFIVGVLGLAAVALAVYALSIGGPWWNNLTIAAGLGSVIFATVFLTNLDRKRDR